MEIQHESIGEVVPFVVPNTIQCPMLEEVSTKVHHWETNDTKSDFFDYCELYTAFQIEGNFGADAGIIPLIHDKNTILDFSDENRLSRYESALDIAE